jgi:hypothetical protein
LVLSTRLGAVDESCKGASANDAAKLVGVGGQQNLLSAALAYVSVELAVVTFAVSFGSQQVLDSVDDAVKLVSGCVGAGRGASGALLSTNALLGSFQCGLQLFMQRGC